MVRSTYNYEEKSEYKSRSNYGTSSYDNDDDRDNRGYSVSRESNLKASQTFYNNRDSRFFSSYDRNDRNDRTDRNDNELTYSNDAAKWTGKSRHSSVRNDESTDGSQDGDDYGRSSHTYYMSNLEKHLRRYDDRDYFSQIYREHFQQSFQSMKFCRFMKQTDPKVLAKKKVYLTKKEVYRSNLMGLKYSNIFQ